MKLVSQSTSYAFDTVLPKDSVDAMEELGLVLKTIHLRMQKDGYLLVNGQVVKIGNDE